MKRTAIAAAAAAAAFLLLGTSAQAQPVSPWYGELGYTFLKVDAQGTSTRPGGIRGVIGYNFHPMFAFEGMLGGGVTDDKKDFAGTTINMKVENYYGLFVKPRYLYRQFEGFARLGYGHIKVKTDSPTPALNSSTSDNDFAWGLGANYNFNPRMYVGLDWMRLSNQSNHHVDGLTLGFGYRW